MIFDKVKKIRKLIEDLRKEHNLPIIHLAYDYYPGFAHFIIRESTKFIRINRGLLFFDWSFIEGIIRHEVAHAILDTEGGALWSNVTHDKHFTKICRKVKGMEAMPYKKDGLTFNNWYEKWEE